MPSAAISRRQHVWKAEGVEMIRLGSHCSPSNPLKLNFHSLLSKLSVFIYFFIFFFGGPSSVKCSVIGGKPCKCETQGFIFRFSKILWRRHENNERHTSSSSSCVGANWRGVWRWRGWEGGSQSKLGCSPPLFRAFFLMHRIRSQSINWSAGEMPWLHRSRPSARGTRWS